MTLADEESKKMNMDLLANFNDDVDAFITHEEGKILQFEIGNLGCFQEII